MAQERTAIITITVTDQLDDDGRPTDSQVDMKVDTPENAEWAMLSFFDTFVAWLEGKTYQATGYDPDGNVLFDDRVTDAHLGGV